MKHIYGRLLETLDRRGRAALAVVIDTEGSAPQVPGSAAIFSSAGLEAGTVGGGLLEATIQEIARRSLDDRLCRLVRVALDAEEVEADGAVCGGSISVLVDPLADEERPVFERAMDAHRARNAGALLTTLQPLQNDLVSVAKDWLPREKFREFALPGRGDAVRLQIERAWTLAEPRFLELKGDRLFIEPVLPSPRLIIAGAGHIGKAVAHLGNLLDFEVTVIDDRAEFANKDSLPDADVVMVQDIASAVGSVPDDPDTYFVIVTRGHRHDADALRACIKRRTAYIGMIGSRHKIGVLEREFLEKGWATAEEWGRVHTPIGLPIRSRTVAEIAVSIAAELVKVRAERQAEVRT
ncbi:MAG: XdhC family protein [Candidatus Aminicenantes bacterium]|nr:XdhC family protein [Candidatus Aminicenantes bacterium]